MARDSATPESHPSHCCPCVHVNRSPTSPPAGAAAGLQTTLDCVANLLNDAKALNQSLVQLPSQFSEVDSMFATANDTFQSARTMISDTIDQLDGLNSTVNNVPNITTYIVSVNDLDHQLTHPPINISDINATLYSADSQRNAVDIPSLRSGVATLNSSVWDPNVVADSSTLSALRQLQPALEELASRLTTGITDLDTFSNTLRCQGTATTCVTAGSTTAPCSGVAPCTGGTAFCTGDGTTACAADSDCPSLGTCPYHQDSFVNAKAALDGYVSLGPDALVSGMSSLDAALASASTAVSGMPDPAALNGDLTALDSALAAVPVDTSISAVGTLQTDLNPSSLGLSTVTDNIASINSAIQSVDLSGARSQLESFQSTLDNIQDQLSILDTLDKMADALVTFFFSTLPSQLPSLSRASLDAASISGGLSGVVRQIASVGDALVDFVNDAMNSTVVSIDVTDTVNEYLPRVSARAAAMRCCVPAIVHRGVLTTITPLSWNADLKRHARNRVPCLRRDHHQLRHASRACRISKRNCSSMPSPTARSRHTAPSTFS